MSPRQLGFLEMPAVEPAVPSPRLLRLGERLAGRVFLGTSSWSFPGWRDVVWAREYSESALAREGLGAYAAHPLLSAVGVDRTFYGPVTDDELATYREQVPDGFRFLVKASEALTLARFPTHARYGKRAGHANPDLFDVGYARDLVVAPFIEGLGAKGGPLLFQFPPQSPDALGGPEGFADRVHRFLDELPKGPRYAVEVRNRELMTARLSDALFAVGAVPCLTAIRGMPDVDEQARALDIFRFDDLVVRWMLTPDLDYAAAKARFSPFTALAREDPTTRDRIASLVAAFMARGSAPFVIVNNKAEGCAPLSIARLAEHLAERLDG